ncbi:MAG: GTP pyrophosphokinase [Desemzia incerta]|uniref:GTP pyrophosphokinase n=1 Tax=Desemzia incerta TaxID=82801 RepID=UPI00331464CE
MTKEDIKKNILIEYDKNKKIYLSFLLQMENLIENLIKMQDIKVSSMNSRIKERDSLSSKIDKKQKEVSEKPKKFKYNNLSDLTDICGIRICTFYSDDVDRIADIIEKEFVVDRENSIDKRTSIEPDKFGYLSLHYILSLPENRLNLTENTSYKDIKFEIQIRSILQHTWAEIEHDLGYKSAEGLPKAVRRDFSRLASLLELADKEFLSIRNYLDDYQNDVNKNIHSTSANKEILIDRITLNEFVKSTFFHETFDFIVNKTNSATKKIMNDVDIDQLSTAFKYLNILTIHELRQLLEKSKLLMIHNLNTIHGEEFESANTFIVDLGVLYYSLYYKIIKDSIPAQALKEIYEILGVTSNYEEDYSDLLHGYNSIFVD